MHSTEITTETLVSTHSNLIIPQQASSDEQLIDLWLHGRSRHTQRSYQHDAERFLNVVGKGLHQVTLGDLQIYATDLLASGLKDSSVYRALSSLKSLFAFGHRLGYLPFLVLFDFHNCENAWQSESSMNQRFCG